MPFCLPYCDSFVHPVIGRRGEGGREEEGEEQEEEGEVTKRRRVGARRRIRRGGNGVGERGSRG